MCQDRESVSIWLKIPADLSCSGSVKWKRVHIDRCIASLVRALQDGGIDMRGSCCGHGDRYGEIALQDGRILRVLAANPEEPDGKD